MLKNPTLGLGIVAASGDKQLFAGGIRVQTSWVTTMN